jgi:lipoate-protein ligase A
METKHYNLPDYKIFENDTNSFITWIPDQEYLILGSSNKSETSLFIEKVNAEGVPVIKRPSGGEAVILSQNTIVSAALFITDKLDNPHHYFVIANTAIIKALTNLGISNLHQKGISDISIKEKKILGSSIYRKKNKIFYHSVLNVSEDISRISYFLRHPKKEPDYRKGRSHLDFVTSLKREGYGFSLDTIKAEIESELSKIILK